MSVMLALKLAANSSAEMFNQKYATLFYLGHPLTKYYCYYFQSKQSTNKEVEKRTVFADIQTHRF